MYRIMALLRFKYEIFFDADMVTATLHMRLFGSADGRWRM